MRNYVIQGEKFVGLCNYVFTPDLKRVDDYYKYTNTFHLAIDPEKVHLVYTHTSYVHDFFKLVRGTGLKIVLVSHNSDENITNYDIPAEVLRWFTTNVNQKHYKLTALPIGLENNRWMHKIDKIKIMSDKWAEDKECRNLIYMNHNCKTNPFKRYEPYQILEKKDFVTAESGVNFQNFESYIDNVYKHTFVICPEGNGIDTHRVWEALYMGAIPIVIHNELYSHFKSLPIMKVQAWSDVTIENLDNWIKGVYYLTPWDFSKLRFDYWSNKILTAVKN